MSTGDVFVRHVKGDLVRTGHTMDEVANRAGVHVNTLRRRLNDPDQLTVHDLKALFFYVSRDTLAMVCPWWREGKA